MEKKIWAGVPAKLVGNVSPADVEKSKMEIEHNTQIGKQLAAEHGRDVLGPEQFKYEKNEEVFGSEKSLYNENVFIEGQ